MRRLEAANVKLQARRRILLPPRTARSVLHDLEASHRHVSRKSNRVGPIFVLPHRSILDQQNLFPLEKVEKREGTRECRFGEEVTGENEDIIMRFIRY